MNSRLLVNASEMRPDRVLRDAQIVGNPLLHTTMGKLTGNVGFKKRVRTAGFLQSRLTLRAVVESIRNR